ncbi:hypothetical protein NC651_037898 [Populus alba x Populus x berolinensis]|nr:hypothetical protein NC651_037898 [Populus alba x Populus x berolinensis]
MDSKVSSLLFIAILYLISSTSTAFNITKILAQYPEFVSFNDLLTQSGLAKEMSSRETITVLALDNSSIGGLNGKPLDIAKRILSAVEPIEAPGIDNMAPPPPPAAVPKKAPAPTAKSPSKAPAPSKVEPSTPTESPTEGPVAADGPVADVPTASPLADAPMADETTAEAASSQVHVGGAVVVIGLLACMMGF